MTHFKVFEKTYLLVFIIILLNGIITWSVNLPQNVGLDVPHGKLNSVSFAPFREGQSPLENSFPSSKQMEEDLALISGVSQGIRTYASAEGNMSLLPDLAKKHDLTMIQGAWLGELTIQNEKEIEAVIRSANKHPDVVKRVIVGNEVLLRGDLKPDALISYIRRVKQAIQQPVSYADVWSMYMKYPQLIQEVDFITIHILPYWEDKPITVKQAPEHIERIYKQVQHEAEMISPNKPILIGESGWPSAGKQRGWAIPSVVNEATFIRAFIKVAQENQFDYNIVEAFNQSWKSHLEGVVGGNWGLFSVNRQPVFSLTGKVYENVRFCEFFLYTAGLFLFGAFFYSNQFRKLRFTKKVSFLVFLQLLCILGVNQFFSLWNTSFNDFQRLQTLFIIALNLFFTLFSLQRLLALLRNEKTSSEINQWLYYFYVFFAVYALYKTIFLGLNGRYISFPTVAVLLSLANIIALMCVNVFFEKVSFNQLNIATLLGCNHKKINKLLGNGLFLSVIILLAGETYAFCVSRDLIAEMPDFFNRLGMSILFTITNMQLVLWLICISIFVFSLRNKNT